MEENKIPLWAAALKCYKILIVNSIQTSQYDKSTGTKA